jgi:RNA polymerase sigma-70 factor, ECF subfamily
VHGDLNEELVRACQGRNAEAQRELYECYKRQVHSLAIYMVGDPAMAEDLTQEIFLKVFRDLHSFRFESSFSSWLYRLATNTCLNALRNRHSRREVDIDAVAGTPVLDSGDSLDQQRMDQQVRQAVEKAILSLKPALRAVVVLRYIENLSYSEIAEILSCSVGTVASRLSRAHRLLAVRLRSFQGMVL